MSRLSAQELKKCIQIPEILDKYGYKEGYSNRCPCCQKDKLSVNKDFLYCFSSSCKLNKKTDIFSFLIESEICTNFNEAYEKVASLGDVDTIYSRRGYSPSRTITLERIFYLYNQSESQLPYEYLLKRGFIKALNKIPIGYSNKDNYLLSKEITKEELELCGLLNIHGKELFNNHVIFPIRDSKGNLSHLQGRYIGEDNGLRWVNTKAKERETINYYLFNEDKAVGYERLFITEGISDGMSLLEILKEDNVVSCFGLSPKLDTHTRLFSQAKELVAIFDNDRNDVVTDSKESLKSWGGILPHLIDLKIKYQHLNIICLYPPYRTGIKDTNDWYNRGLTEEILYNEIKKRGKELFDFIFNHYAHKSIHSHLFRYIKKTKDTRVSQELDYIIRKEPNIVDYINNI